MDRDPRCIFCRIVAGEAEASFAYQDDWVTAFMDLYPANPGHVLVVPNEHCSSLEELPAESGERMFRVAQVIASHIRKVTDRTEAVNLLLADGSAAGQTVFHAHLHVIPRFSGDGLGIRLHATYPSRASRDHLDELARALKDRTR